MTTEKTTIWITKSTRERLKDIGRKGETYDEIITRLLDERETRDIIIEANKVGTP